MLEEIELSDEKTVKIQKGSIEVIGQILDRTKTFISVEIIKPYNNVILSSRFWRVSFLLYAKHSPDYLGETGDRAAETLLNEAYEICKGIEYGGSDLLNEFERFKAEKTEIEEKYMRILNSLFRKKHVFKMKFKIGEVSETEYADVIKHIRKAKWEKDNEIEHAMLLTVGKYFNGEIFHQHKYKIAEMIESAISKNIEDKKGGI